MDERLPDSCPSFPELIRAHERELPPEVCASLTAHARRCAGCQARLREAEAILHATGSTLTADVFTDPAARARAARFAQKLHSRKQTRIHRPARRPLQRWLSVAAMLPLLVIGFMLSRPNTTILHADELIARAVTQARQRPGLEEGAVAMQRVRIRMMPARETASSGSHGARYAPFLAVRELENGSSVQAWPAAATAVSMASTGGVVGARETDDPSLARLLEAHHFDWREPLGLRGFLAWRATLTEKRDRVTLSSDAEFVLRTSTPEGLLREVHLTLDRQTFRVIRQLLVFEGIGSLEVEEIAEWVRRGKPAGTVLVAEAAAVESSAPRLARLPVASERTEVAPIALAAWLDRTFGPGVSPTKATFVPDVRHLLADATRQLNALYALAPHPSDAAIWGEPKEPANGDPNGIVPVSVSTVSGGSADAAQAGAADHTAAIDQRYREMNATLGRLSSRMAVLFGSTPRCEARDHAPADWSSRTAAGLDRSRRLERLMQDVLAQSDVTDDERSPDGARQASRAFDALWDTMNCGAARD